MKNEFRILLLIMASLFCILDVWAHGEDKLGPDGGFIRMPGAFHAELVPLSKNQVKVYLLDIDWKNPSVKNSMVKLKVGKHSASCLTKNKQYFLCTFTIDVDLSQKLAYCGDRARREKWRKSQV